MSIEHPHHHEHRDRASEPLPPGPAGDVREEGRGVADGRRAMLRICIGGMAVGSAAAVGFPVVSFLGFPRRLATDKPMEISLATLPPGQVQYMDFRGTQIIVLAKESGPLVLNAACTHLGCNVTWDTAEQVFRCPCHGAVFDSSGDVVSGPVNKPLEKVPFDRAGDRIVIT